MNKSDNTRQRDQFLRAFRWQVPLVVALSLPVSIAEAPRYWYVGVVIAAVVLIGYVQIIRIERERQDLRPGRQRGRRTPATKKAGDEKHRHA